MPPETVEAPTGVTIVHDRPAPAKLNGERRTEVLSPAELLSGARRQPQPGTARGDMRANLQKRSATATGLEAPEMKPAEQEERPGAAEAEGAELEEGQEQQEQVVEQQEQADAKPEAGKGKPGKINPFKELKAVRSENETLRKQLHEAKTAVLPENDRNLLTERATKAETRAKELEDEIRFTNYSKSAEFNEKFEKPYVDAWERAMRALKVTVDDGAGGRRPAAATDLQALTNMSLEDAQDHAEQIFGKFANVAMLHRDKILELYEARENALVDAKKNGGERQKKLQQQQDEFTTTLTKEIGKIHQEFTEAALKDPVASKYISPIKIDEGKQPTPEEKEWNDALEEGEKFVSDGWGKSPLERGISPEEKRLRVKRHVAIWHRAKAFKGLRLKFERLEKAHAQALKDLGEYKESTPGGGGRVAGNGAKAPVNARQSFHQRLQKVAAR